MSNIILITRREVSIMLIREGNTIKSVMLIMKSMDFNSQGKTSLTSVLKVINS